MEKEMHEIVATFIKKGYVKDKIKWQETMENALIDYMTHKNVRNRNKCIKTIVNFNSDVASWVDLYIPDIQIKLHTILRTVIQAAK